MLTMKKNYYLQYMILLTGNHQPAGNDIFLL